MPDQDSLKQSIVKSLLFKDVNTNDIEQIIYAGIWRKVEQGQYIYHKDGDNQNFYIVASGEVELSLTEEGSGQLIVSHIGPGGHFGETSLLTRNKHCLNARALTEISLLCFDQQTFNSVLLTNDVVQRQLSIALADRLRISFRDHATTLSKSKNSRTTSSKNLDPNFLSEPESQEGPEKQYLNSETRSSESTFARQIRKAVRLFSDNLDPVLLTGETGTGRRMVAYEIHRASAYKNGPYTEIDIRDIDPTQLEVELFGYGKNSSAFSQIDQLGIFERLQKGTLVLNNSEYMEPDFQFQLAEIIRNAWFCKVGSAAKVTLCTRIILICVEPPQQEENRTKLLPGLYSMFANQHFCVAPLRAHRRDIPRLVEYYLKRYSLQYGKTISKVDDQTMGMFINYDWPGNLAEMASVLQRAVILGKNNEPLNNQILLGLPKAEGKWEFNLLRLKPIRAFLSSPLFPVLPRAVVGIFFVLVLAVLFFGPAAAEKNIGLTLSWVVGWPLLIFAFFFLSRTWCSVCGLSVPGWLAQMVLKPKQPTPQIIKQYSGWIMALLCILLFWIETTWDAYHSPRLTAWIILSITLGSLFFSMFFKRRAWCRYLCPLGAINALFSMPSVLELRANTHMCMNRCSDHLCYSGDSGTAGCPMFRHPFLVDNNRDCILCGQCIKNCKLQSIHLNLRLAPQELWNQQSPRLADSLLVVSLAAIFYPFAVSQKYPAFIQSIAETISTLGLPDNSALTSSIFFFGCIFFYLIGYFIMSQIMARTTGNRWTTTASILGYGMIPLVLGAFMAAHLEIFVDGIWLLLPNLRDIIGMGGDYSQSRFMSSDATFVLQFITISGSLIASLYATQRIIKRLLTGYHYKLKMFTLPAFLLCLSALAYLQLV